MWSASANFGILLVFLLRLKFSAADEDESFCEDRLNKNLGFCINAKTQIKHCSSLNVLLRSGSESDFFRLRETLCSEDLTEENLRVCCPYKDYNEVKQTTIEDYGYYPMHRNFRLLPSQTACGTLSSADRIIGGLSAKPGDFPWVVRIGSRDSPTSEPYFFCTGTLINERYILTAAHCLTRFLGSVDQAVVRLADTDDAVNPESITIDGTIVVATSPFIDVGVEEVVVHEGYALTNDYPAEHDIGLIRLNKQVDTSSPFLKPICLPFLREYHLHKSLRDHNLIGQKVFIAGWGKTDNDLHVGSQVLQYLRVEVQSNIFCRISYKNVRNITDNQLCAGGEKGKSACLGDSGGPMTQMSIAVDPHSKSRTERSYQLGITSYGKYNCAGENEPSVFTKVRSYLTWILDNIRK